MEQIGGVITPAVSCRQLPSKLAGRQEWLRTRVLLSTGDAVAFLLRGSVDGVRLRSL